MEARILCCKKCNRILFYYLQGGAHYVISVSERIKHSSIDERANDCKLQGL